MPALVRQVLIPLFFMLYTLLICLLVKKRSSTVKFQSASVSTPLADTRQPDVTASNQYYAQSQSVLEYQDRSLSCPSGKPNTEPTGALFSPETELPHSNTSDTSCESVIYNRNASVRNDEPVTQEEEQAMGNLVSREEMDTLFGTKSTSRQISLDEKLTDAVTAVAKALRSFTSLSTEWQVAWHGATTWATLHQTCGLAPEAVLLMLEARVSGGSVFVAAATLTACRLDDAVNANLGDANDDTAFTGWRRSVEYMLADLCLHLLPEHKAMSLLPRTLPARRWSPTVGGAPFGAQAHERLIVLSLNAIDDPTLKLFVLLPNNTLANLMGEPIPEFVHTISQTTIPEPTNIGTGTDTGTGAGKPTTLQATELANTAQPASIEAAAAYLDATELESPSSELSLVGNIPLSVATTLEVGRLSVRAVAAWHTGTLVPVCLQPGNAAELVVNGRCLARGRLVANPNGDLAVEISTVLPATVDAG